MLVGAGCVLKLGTGVGFLAACATALAFRFTHPRGRPASATVPGSLHGPHTSPSVQGEGCHWTPQLDQALAGPGGDDTRAASSRAP